jgi:hypothetical protein
MIFETLKGWRTIAFNALVALGVAVPAMVAYLADDTSWSRYLPDGAGIVAIILVNLANIFLRFFTSTPVGKAD